MQAFVVSLALLGPEFRLLPRELVVHAFKQIVSARSTRAGCHTGTPVDPPAFVPQHEPGVPAAVSRGAHELVQEHSLLLLARPAVLARRHCCNFLPRLDS